MHSKSKLGGNLMYCGKCGKKVPDGYDYCMYCGAKIENKDITKRKKNHKKFIVIITLIVAICGGSFFFFQSNAKNVGYLRNTRWGMSLSEVKNTEKGSNISNDNSTLIYLTDDNIGLEKINTTVSYSFDNGKLNKGTILVFTKDSGKDDQTVLNNVLTAYRTQYGKEKKTEASYQWTTPKSQIEVAYVMEGSIMITYNEIGSN